MGTPSPNGLDCPSGARLRPTLREPAEQTQPGAVAAREGGSLSPRGRAPGGCDPAPGPQGEAAAVPTPPQQARGLEAGCCLFLHTQPSLRP